MRAMRENGMSKPKYDPKDLPGWESRQPMRWTFDQGRWTGVEKPMVNAPKTVVKKNPFNSGTFDQTLPSRRKYR